MLRRGQTVKHFACHTHFTCFRNNVWHFGLGKSDASFLFLCSHLFIFLFTGTSFFALNRGMKVDTTYRNGISTMWAQLAYCENAGNIIDGKRSGATRSVVEITVATVAMVLASFLVMAWKWDSFSSESEILFPAIGQFWTILDSKDNMK